MSEQQVNEQEAKDNEVKQQQLRLIRESLIKSVNEKYQDLIKYIRQVPIPQQCFYEGLKQMDFGMLWIKECLNHSPIIEAAKEPQQQEKEQNAAPQS